MEVYRLAVCFQSLLLLLSAVWGSGSACWVVTGSRNSDWTGQRFTSSKRLELLKESCGNNYTKGVQGGAGWDQGDKGQDKYWPTGRVWVLQNMPCAICSQEQGGKGVWMTPEGGDYQGNRVHRLGSTHSSSCKRRWINTHRWRLLPHGE